MPDVHPSARVAGEVDLADDARVGPGCVIEGAVRVGAGSRLLHRVSLTGPLTLGRGTTIYPNATVGDPSADLPAGASNAEGTAGVLIGDGNVIREGVCIDAPAPAGHGGRPTTLGRDNYLMVNCYVGSGVRLGDGCTLVNGVVVGAGAEVHDGATLGGHGVVAAGCRVGRLSMLGGLCDLTQDLPPFCVAYTPRRVGGLNLVGLRRAGLREHIEPLRRAFHVLYREGLEVGQAIGRIEAEVGGNPLCREFAAFLRESVHGITPYGGFKSGR